MRWMKYLVIGGLLAVVVNTAKANLILPPMPVEFVICRDNDSDPSRTAVSCSGLCPEFTSCMAIRNLDIGGFECGCR